MKKSTNQSATIAFGAIAVVLTFIACGLAIVGGLVMLIAYTYVYGAGLITMLAGVVLFFIFIVGFVAVVARSAHAALASAIVSLICATAIICCMGVPFQSKAVCVMPILAAILAFAAFIMFTLCYVNTPARKKNISEKSFQLDKLDLQNELQQELKILNDDFANNLITQEEYNEKKQAIFNRRYDYLDSAQQAASYKTATKKQTACAFAIPSAVMAVIFAIVIPTVHFGVCKYAYAGLISNISDMKEMHYCGHGSSYMRYDELLPNNYRDVAMIRAEKEDYQVNSCLFALERSYEQDDGSRARLAYKRLLELQKADPRWGFDTVIGDSEVLIMGAKWSCDSAFLSYYFDEENGEWILDTNLPNITDKEDGGEDLTKLYLSCDEGKYIIGYNPTVSIVGWGFPAFEISDFTYDEAKDEFSIKVYCVEDETTYTMTCAEKYSWSDFEW